MADLERIRKVRRESVRGLIATTHPDGPCQVCEFPLNASGPEGKRSVLLFVAWMEDIDDDDSWRIDGLHAWCVPELMKSREGEAK